MGPKVWLEKHTNACHDLLNDHRTGITRKTKSSDAFNYIKSSESLRVVFQELLNKSSLFNTHWKDITGQEGEDFSSFFLVLLLF